MILEEPHFAYVVQWGWTLFISTPIGMGDGQLSLEFYTNLKAAKNNTVMVCNRPTNFSVRTINSLLDTKHIKSDEYTSFIKSEYHIEEVIKLLKGTTTSIFPNWRKIQRATIT